MTKTAEIKAKIANRLKKLREKRLHLMTVKFPTNVLSRPPRPKMPPQLKAALKSAEKKTRQTIAGCVKKCANPLLQITIVATIWAGLLTAFALIPQYDIPINLSTFVLENNVRVLEVPVVSDIGLPDVNASFGEAAMHNLKNLMLGIGFGSAFLCASIIWVVEKIKKDSDYPSALFLTSFVMLLSLYGLTVSIPWYLMNRFDTVTLRTDQTSAPFIPTEISQFFSAVQKFVASIPSSIPIPDDVRNFQVPDLKAGAEYNVKMKNLKPELVTPMIALAFSTVGLLLSCIFSLACSNYKKTSSTSPSANTHTTASGRRCFPVRRPHFGCTNLNLFRDCLPKKTKKSPAGEIDLEMGPKNSDSETNRVGAELNKNNNVAALTARFNY